jgi:tRNA (adenine37-N6)-methyltransferase
MDRYPERREFGLRLYDQEIRWTIETRGMRVIAVAPVAESIGIDRECQAETSG